MDKVFTNRADLCDVADRWSVSLQAAQLRAVLAQAAARATRTGQATPASLVLSVPASDPLRILRAFQRLYAGQCLYWEQPSRQMALVGAGAALNLETHGAARFDEAALAVHVLRSEAVIAYDSVFTEPVTHGPVLFGGFRFDPLSTHTPLWRDFPAGLLILPTLLFRQQHQQTTLTLSQLVRATDDLDRLSNSLSMQVTTLSQLVQSQPDFSTPTDQESQGYRVHNVCSEKDWRNLVAGTVRAIQQGEFAKIVLARAAQVAANEQPFTLTATLQRLRQSYPAANVFAFQRGTRAFLGATPERLLHAQGGQLHTVALAGSAPRGENEAED
ncbi:MAG: chorismate-binding protein, partial [Ktedonobacteraceae bacterium]